MLTISETNTDWVRPVGFQNLFVRNEYLRSSETDEIKGYQRVPGEKVLFHQTAVTKLKELRELGFFDYPGWNVQFNRTDADTPDKVTFTQRSMSIRIASFTPKRDFIHVGRLSVKANNGQPEYNFCDKLTAEICRVRGRFREYDIELENGWRPIYALDILTRYERSWSETQLKTIDFCISSGIPLKRIGKLLYMGAVVKDICELAAVPDSWAKTLIS